MKQTLKKYKKSFILITLLVAMWLFLFGPFAPWQVVTIDEYNSNSTNSARYGSYFWSLNSCEKALIEEINKKRTLTIFNESLYSIAPGKPDPDRYNVLLAGYCGKACYSWNPIEFLITGLIENNISCYSRSDKHFYQNQD